ncbi:MAG: hypothetical protein JWQ97_1436 [Phenylobacterium sp.]|nr:hypothetical protein [Phenylobacterium sp.]
MPLFVLSCIDKPNALQARLNAREAHLSYLGETGVMKLAGPFLNEAGEPAGSLMIVDVDDLAAAKSFSVNDPYVKAGVFERVEIRPFRLTLGKL